jgi:hypothetical protein
MSLLDRIKSRVAPAQRRAPVEEDAALPTHAPVPPAFDPAVISRQLMDIAKSVSRNESVAREAQRFENNSRGEQNWDRDNLLHRLAVKYKPSKRQHNYIKHYWLHFAPVREQVKSFVEIGVQTPGSMMMWEEFFPNATIYGIDIDEKCREFAGGRRQIVIGDQKNEAFLRDFIDRTGGQFDVIVDDGEHSEAAILTSFCWLFPAMSTHGIYAVEDLIDLRNALRFFRSLEKHINYWPKDYPGMDWPYLYTFDEAANWLDRNVVGLHFYRYLCLVNRGFNPEDNPYLHKVRHPDWPGSHNAAFVAAQRAAAERRK